MTTRFAAAVVPCLLMALAALSCFRALPAQEQPQDLPAFHADRLQVKLVEGCAAEWRDGRLVSHAGVDLSAVQRWFEQADCGHLFTALDWAGLDQLHRDTCAKLPQHNRPGHLGLWFRLRATDAAHAAALRERLAAEPLVQEVYHQPIFYPASCYATSSCAGRAPSLPVGDDPAPPTPEFMSLQVQFGPTPVGHGIRQCAGVVGARGRGRALRMVETSWFFGHEDVDALVAANVIGPVPAFSQTPSLHGLSGASLVIADRNAFGITGIADEAAAGFVAMELSGGLENAMLAAMNSSQPGDTVMVVLMALIPSLGPGSFLPIEFFQSVFDIVLTLTSNDRHVCMPAGNGSRSLDDPALLNRFDRGFRDSGALLAGASNGALLEKAGFSNWGTRIDANAHGEGVISCGYGNLWNGGAGADYSQSYTNSATGTSSATPHLAGLALALQGAARWQLGRSLSNQEVVDLIGGHGPSTPDVIGVHTDLVAAFEALGVFDGLRMLEPDVGLGDTIAVRMEGADGALVALAGAFGLVDVPVGLNRNLHLDPGSLATLGAYGIVGGEALFQMVVPVDASLHGVDLFFQAARLDAGAPLHLTNSCQVTIL